MVGNGTLTIRIDGQSRTFPSGTTLDLAFLVTPDGDAASPAPTQTPPVAPTESPAEDTPADTSLGDTTERCLADFNTAIDSGDADQALGAVLELEEAITAWSADTLQSDDADRARATLRSMITRLGDAAVKGLDDPTLVRAPLVLSLIHISEPTRP